jgi:hypothetical protein
MTLICDPQGRYCPSRSAPTPCGVSAGKIGKCVTALRHRFRPVLDLTSLPVFTREADAHESAVVRRHHTPGAIRRWVTIADCAAALVASVVTTITVGIRAYVTILAPLFGK